MCHSLEYLDIDQLVAVKGIVVRVSNIIPDMRLGHFCCSQCGFSLTVENVKGRINEPTKCPRPDCQMTGTMLLLHNRCVFSDKQIIRLQETPGTSNMAIIL